MTKIFPAHRRMTAEILLFFFFLDRYETRVRLVTCRVMKEESFLQGAIIRVGRGQNNPELALSAKEEKKRHRIVCHVGKELYFWTWMNLS